MFLSEVKHTCKMIVDHGGYSQNKEKVHQLSSEYIERGISPGGSSDMLVLKIIYDNLNYLIKKKDTC